MRVDTRSSSDPLRRRLRRLTTRERLEEALAFTRLFHRENQFSDAACHIREAEIRRSLRQSGTYEHTREELAFGARVAWRNHARCIGRLFWRSLEVIDCRGVLDPDEMAARIMDHMALALSDGRVRSIITVFSPAIDATAQPYVESAQVVQYAGYVDATGQPIGDAQNLEATRIARSLGWQPPGPPGMFDVLPLIIRDHRGRRLMYEVPRTVIREVEIVHPDYPGIADLGLRWYAMPCVSNMIMTVGGLDYPCAPFSGFYMNTEIASRNLADENRYNMLPTVASAIGDPPRKEHALWKDRALLELNRAVLHSYDRAGVTMVDHHTASEQYMEFARREHTAGRIPSGDWSWIVPPQGSPSCPVFHLPMRNLHAVPNYYHSRARDGAGLHQNYDSEVRSTARRRWDRLKRRFRTWSMQRD